MCMGPFFNRDGIRPRVDTNLVYFLLGQKASFFFLQFKRKILLVPKVIAILGVYFLDTSVLFFLRHGMYSKVALVIQVLNQRTVFD